MVASITRIKSPLDFLLDSISIFYCCSKDRLCGLVVRVLGYRSGGPGSIPGTTRRKSSGSGTGSTQPREYNWGATWYKSYGSCIENREYGRRDPSRWPRGTLYPQSSQSLRRQAAVARSVQFARGLRPWSYFFLSFQKTWTVEHFQNIWLLFLYRSLTYIPVTRQQHIVYWVFSTVS
jgi:hypothetical protein